MNEKKDECQLKNFALTIRDGKLSVLNFREWYDLATTIVLDRKEAK